MVNSQSLVQIIAELQDVPSKHLPEDHYDDRAESKKPPTMVLAINLRPQHQVQDRLSTVKSKHWSNLMHVFHILSYSMPLQGLDSGGTHENADLCHALCRSHELNREHVRKITFFRDPWFLCRSRDLVCLFHKYQRSTWHQAIYTQLARAWHKPLASIFILFFSLYLHSRSIFYGVCIASSPLRMSASNRA